MDPLLAEVNSHRQTLGAGRANGARTEAEHGPGPASDGVPGPTARDPCAPGWLLGSPRGRSPPDLVCYRLPVTIRMPFGALGAVAPACDIATPRAAIVTFAVRALTLLLVAIEYDSVPEPDLVPVGIVIQAGIPVARQVQPLPVVTLMDPDRPEAAALMLRGLTVKAQAPDWLTVNVIPAMRTVPVRAALAVLAATTTLTVPLPVRVPVAPIVSQVALLVADHWHALLVVTATLAVSPAEGDERLVGEMP
jgi:hypothetical protein